MQGNPSFNQAMNARESDSKKELKNSVFFTKIYSQSYIMYYNIIFFRKQTDFH